MLIVDYDVVVFDCDGVIFNSNSLKIDAMRQALKSYPDRLVENCLEYFSNNFGKSRYHHIRFFIDNFLGVLKENVELEEARILQSYSESCVDLYQDAQLAPDFLKLVEYLRGRGVFLYVASGSDQVELNEVFVNRRLIGFFNEVLGSPTGKTEHLRGIKLKNQNRKCLMVGDAKSDFYAAQENGFDFLFYSPYSNVKVEMLALAQSFGFGVVESFSEVF